MLDSWSDTTDNKFEISGVLVAKILVEGLRVETEFRPGMAGIRVPFLSNSARFCVSILIPWNCIDSVFVRYRSKDGVLDPNDEF